MDDDQFEDCFAEDGHDTQAMNISLCLDSYRYPDNGLILGAAPIIG